MKSLLVAALLAVLMLPSAAHAAGRRVYAIHFDTDVNPVTQVVDAARALTIGHGHALEPTLATLAWLVGLLLVFVPLAVRAYRRA